MKLTLWGFGLLVGGLIGCIISIHLLLLHREHELDRAWQQTLGYTPRQFYQSLVTRFPKSDKNETARQLEVRCAKLGIALSPSENKPALQAFAPHLDAQLIKPNDDIGAPPEEVRTYLTDHAGELEALYAAVRKGDVPRWEMDVNRLAEAPIPPLALHQTLQRVIAVDILEKTRRGEGEKALEAMEVSWKINQALRERPETVTQLVATHILNRQAGVLRKMKGVPTGWQNRIINPKWRELFSQTVAWDALITAEFLIRHNGSTPVFGPPDRIIFSPVGKPLRRLWRVQLLDAASQTVAEFDRSQFLSFDPDAARRQFVRSLSRWNIASIVFPDFSRFWKIVTRSALNLELTAEVLHLKQMNQNGGNTERLKQGVPTASFLCPDARWVHQVNPEGDLSITCTRLPDWLQKEARDELPLTYSLKAKS